MAKSKRSGIWGRILRVLKFAVTLFVGLSIFGVILLRFVNPPFTWLMVLRGFERKSDGKDWKIDKKWISFDDIADPMKRAAVAAEDQTFLENHGFDFKAMEKAIDKNQHSHKRFPLARAQYRSQSLRGMVHFTDRYFLEQTAGNGSIPERNRDGRWHLWCGSRIAGLFS